MRMNECNSVHAFAHIFLESGLEKSDGLVDETACPSIICYFFCFFFNKGNIGGTDFKNLCLRMYVSLVLYLWLHMN